MSRPISVFIYSNQAFDNIALDIETILSLKMKLISDDEGRKYQYNGLGLTMTFFTDHDLEDDKGIPFSDDQYEIDLDRLRNGLETEILKNFQYYTAMYIYKRIVNDLKYPSMMVDNLQNIMEKNNDVPLCLLNHKRDHKIQRIENFNKKF
jgi:hypothetical protein